MTKEAAVEETAEEVTEETPAEVADTAADTEPATDDNASEIARLKKENEDLKARTNNPPASRPQVTSADLASMTDEEWEPIEKKYGQTRGEIMARMEAKEAKTSAARMEARSNVAEALDDAAALDPQVNKLKVYMKEFLSDVSLEDKLDPEKLKRHVEKAKVYARGRALEKSGGKIPTTTTTRKDTVKQPAPTGDDGGDEEDGEEVRGGQTVELGNLKLKIKDLPEKLQARAKDIKHPDIPNSVMFRGFDKAPKFNRGE